MGASPVTYYDILRVSRRAEPEAFAAPLPAVAAPVQAGASK
jgi:hypothetical protein